MFNWLKKEDQGQQISIRDTLFGDMPLSAWKGSGQSNIEPWASFLKVEKHIEADRPQDAIEELMKITEVPGLESRHYVQAWHFLKQMGVMPPDTKAKEVYGVVVEVTMEQGLDIVAAYADHTARYYNYSGAAIIWEKPDDSLREEIENLLKAGKGIVGNIGPWEEERPAAPPKGHARASMLTPSGLHFGQAPFDVLVGDKMGGPIIMAATRLMQVLIQKGEQASA